MEQLEETIIKSVTKNIYALFPLNIIIKYFLDLWI